MVHVSLTPELVRLELVEEMRTGLVRLGLMDELSLLAQLPPPDRAKEIREAAGVSVARMARELHVTRGAVDHWERGRRHPRGAAALGYCLLLKHLERLVSLQTSRTS